MTLACAQHTFLSATEMQEVTVEEYLIALGYKEGKVVIFQFEKKARVKRPDFQPTRSQRLPRQLVFRNKQKLSH